MSTENSDEMYKTYIQETIYVPYVYKRGTDMEPKEGEFSQKSETTLD